MCYFATFKTSPDPKRGKPVGFKKKFRHDQRVFVRFMNEKGQSIWLLGLDGAEREVEDFFHSRPRKSADFLQSVLR